MDLTIEQALQSAVYAHKLGKLDQAEALYRAILESQPGHPYANYNLGVLALSLNKIQLALPLLKAAIEINPKQEQFWISYIDTLINEGHYENAKAALQQAKLYDLAKNLADTFETRLNDHRQVKESIAKATQQEKITLVNLNQKGSPSQSMVDRLIKHYQMRRYDLAEDLAITITKQYPDHLLGWKVLGSVYKKKEKLLDSLFANQKAVAIAGSDAESHNNLGNTLKELGRPLEAKASYSKALAIKPDFAQAHNNLGGVLKELGRLGEAETSYKKAIGLMPNFAEAHNNLGVTLQELGKMHEAAESYNKAIAIKPDYAQAYSNLGVVLQELGQLKEAEASFNKAIKLNPELKHVRYNFGVLLYVLKRYPEAAELLKSEKYKCSQSYLLTCFYFMNDKVQFSNLLNYLISQGENNVLIGSFSCRANIKFGIKTYNPFCNEPLKYVRKKSLRNDLDFSKIFFNPISNILNENKLSYKKQGQLINGTQTSGNLFSFESAEINEIKRIIDLEVEKYRLEFIDSNEGLIISWPKSYTLYGWLISMKSGGELRPHIHENGWISGSIYINVPPKSNVNDGNLVVCIEDNDELTESQKKIIDVSTGSMCLFPASLLHYTIPFESEEERIVLAFDVIPS